MLVVKYIIIFLVFCISFYIGTLISKKYNLRLVELKDFKNALNIIESKIKFTYEPLPDIFIQTSKMVSKNISRIFVQASNNMKTDNAEEAWEKSIKIATTNLNEQDLENIKSFGKMLGKTDKEGQLSRIELTKTFIEMQIEKAKIDEQKNAKMYKTLGAIVGLAFVIILIWKGEKMNIDLLFKIAAIGILVAVLHQVLARAGREDQAMMTTLAGLIIVLTMVVKEISTLFATVRALFSL